MTDPAVRGPLLTLLGAVVAAVVLKLVFGSWDAIWAVLGIAAITPFVIALKRRGREGEHRL